MSITVLGYVLIPLTIICLFFKPKYLLPLTIIFSGFTGSAVMIIKGDLGIQPSYFFFVIWLIYMIVNGIKEKRLIDPLKTEVLNRKSLCFFMLYATVSIILPFFFSSSGITVINVNDEIVPVSFSSSCVTQLMYLWFAFAFLICLSSQIREKKITIDAIIKYYLIGVGVVCLVTFYQIISFDAGLPFDTLFRQNTLGNIQGTRIYGPCNEASLLAYYLVTALPFCVRGKDWKRYLLLGCVIALGIYSYSSSFLLGLGVWAVAEIFLLVYKGRIKIFKVKTLLICVGIIGIIVVVLKQGGFLSLAFDKFISTITAENGSGMDRMACLKLLLRAFSKAPLTGIGFGTCRGKDLFSTWLAELGLIGAGFLIAYFFKLFRQKSRVEIKLAIVLVWMVMLVSVPEPYNLFVWILMAMVEYKAVKKPDVNTGEIKK